MKTKATRNSENHKITNSPDHKINKSPDHQITRSPNLAAVFFILLTGCAAVPAAFTPMQSIGPDQFSYSLFDKVLHEHVRDGMVDYPAIAGDDRFRTYITQLDHVDPNAFPTKEERLAFWINAYNAYAIQGILDGLSPQTLWGRYKYFIDRQYRVGGEAVNLYDLERSIIVKNFHEPRIHFAIVCASRSCPRLRSEAYVATRLHDQLEDQAREFINDGSRNQFDRGSRVARLSKIFDWYSGEFRAHSATLVEYVRPYVNNLDLRGDLDPIRYSVEFLDYDWSLNGTPPVAARAQ